MDGIGRWDSGHETDRYDVEPVEGVRWQPSSRGFVSHYSQP